MTAKPKTEEIKNILQTLRICADDSRLALQQCEKLLHLRPDDATARKYKASVLIRSSSFDKAIAFLRSKTLNPAARFHLAYCYYRKEQYAEALKQLEPLPRDTHVEILRAQIFYRTGEFASASEVYRGILPNLGQNRIEYLFHDVLASALAAMNEAGDRESITTLLKEHIESAQEGDILLNAALTSDAASANDQIDFIYSVRPQSDLMGDEEVIAEDDASLCALLAGLCILAGRRDEATRYLRALSSLPAASTSVVLQAVCSNNWICLQESAEIFDSLRKIKHCLSPVVDAKLNRAQRIIVKYNNALLHMHMRKFPIALNIAKNLMKDFPNKTHPALAGIYAVGKCGKGKPVEVVELFAAEKGLDSIEGFPTALRLFLAQLRFDHCDVRRDLQRVLQNLPEDERYSLGVVSAVLRMSTSKDSPKEVVSLLQNAISHSESKSPQKTESVAALTEMLADFYISLKMYDEAVAVLRRLATYTNDPKTVEKLVYALSFVNVDEAYALGIEHDCFTETSDWTYDGAAIEAEELPRKTEESAQVSVVPKPKHTHSKKKKKSIAIDGENAPDLERWIPLRDRPSLKKAGKKTLARMAEDRRQYALEKRVAHAERLAAALVNEQAHPMEIETTE